VDLPSLVSIEATGICIPVGNCEVLFATIYKSPNRTWCDIDITELLRFRNKCILAGDLNAKHPFWNCTVSNPSGEKMLQLFDASDFEISAPQCPTHYSPVEMEMYWILWCIRISDFQMSSSLIFWIQITYQ
jgi:hypothetical protein